MTDVGRLNTAEYLFWRFFPSADIQRIQKMQVDLILYFSKTDLRPSDSGEYFDEERVNLIKKIDRQFSYDVKEMGVNPEKLIEITCSTYARLSLGLWDMAGKAQDKRSADSYRATAWSVLAKDASGLLYRNTDYSIDREWKDKLWKIERLENRKDLVVELDKFAKRDPEIFKLKIRE